jgi:signal transduction histidine kinase
VRYGFRTRLILAFSLPAIALLGAFYFYAHYIARQALEDELGRRLVSVAHAAAERVTPDWAPTVAPGDETTRGYLSLQRRLEALRERTGVARLYVFDRSFNSLCDSQKGVAIGSRYHQLLVDSADLGRLFQSGSPAASTLFTGKDGTPYKSGYAPVYRDVEGGGREVVAAVAADGSAELFARLWAFRRSLIGYGVLATSVIVATGLLVAGWVTRPVATLVAAAQSIGQGDLTHPIAVTARDELGLLATAMDDMRRDLHQRNQQQQMMLAGIAHEVRNPLGGLELTAGRLREKLAGDDRLKYVDRIERELGRLSRVVNDFLDFAREKPPQLEPIDMATLARDVGSLVAQDAGSVTIEVQAPESLAMEADPGQLRGALLNLVRNAAQATADRPGGRVTLRVQARGAGPVRSDRRTTAGSFVDLPAAGAQGFAGVAGDTGPGGAAALSALPEPAEHLVRVVVADNGCGIAPADLAEIFRPFFTTKERGTGLGLPLCQKIILAHGGHIDVLSEKDKGTRVGVELPRPRAPHAAPAAASADPGASASA